MPSNSFNIDELLRSKARRVVPVAFLFDESEFATSAEKWLQLVLDKELAKVVRSGRAENAGQVVDCFFTAGFNQSVAPLTLMNDVPAWCVWFLSDSTTQPETFLQTLKTIEEERPGQFLHFLFLHIVQAERAKLWIAKSLDHLYPFLLCSAGAIKRTEQDLARAAVCYVYSGWRKHWEAGDANLLTALALSQDGRVFTLGMGASELDVEYHAQRCGEKVLDILRNQLLATDQQTDRPALKSIQELLEFLLPDWYLATEGDGNAHSIQVQMGKESANLHYLERKRKRLDASLSHRHHFQNLLLRLKDKFYFLSFVALWNARRFVENRAKWLFHELWPSVRDYLQLPPEPHSLTHVLAQRIRFCAEYAEDMQSTQVVGDGPSGSFQQDYKNAWARISAIPNLLGAILRLALIAIGLASLLLAPFWWGGIRHPLADDLLRDVALGSAVLLVLCFAGVFIHYYYACSVAIDHVERAERNVEIRHLRDVAGLAINQVHNAGNALQRIMGELLEALNSLSLEINKATMPPQSRERSPTGCWLSDNSVDSLIQRSLAGLAEQAYGRVANDLNGQKDKNGLVKLDPALWQKLLAQHCAGVAAEAIERLTFDDCADAMQPNPGERESLIDGLIAESLKPAWPAAAALGSPVLCFSEPGRWQACCGRHDTIQFYNLHLKDMVIVSVIPLRGGVS